MAGSRPGIAKIWWQHFYECNPSYEQIVSDVCHRLHVKNICKHDTAEEMEEKLLLYITEKMINELSEEDIDSIITNLHIKNCNLTKQSLIALTIYSMRFNQQLFVRIMDYLLCLITKMLVGRGILVFFWGSFSRASSLLLGPIGWTLLTTWTLWDIAGPAYRVTAPAVIQVAYMRFKYNQNH